MHGENKMPEDYCEDGNCFDICYNCGEKLIKLNNEWRCKTCEAFCNSRGAE